MCMTSEEAALRQADHENRVAELARRKRANTILNVAALAVMVYVVLIELIKYGGL